MGGATGEDRCSLRVAAGPVSGMLLPSPGSSASGAGNLKLAGAAVFASGTCARGEGPRPPGSGDGTEKGACRQRPRGGREGRCRDRVLPTCGRRSPAS